MDTMLDVNIFHRTAEFDTWLSDLKDKIGKASIVNRIRAAEAGNFGGCERWAREYSRCASTSDRGTGCITREAARWCISYW
jgi:hypothetical protein